MDLLGLGAVAPVVGTFDLLLDLLHLLCLSVPLGGGLLGLLVEELKVWLPVAASQTVPESGELTVVVVEVQVVHGVASSAVDYGAVGNVLAIVDQHGPDVDEHEKRNVGELLKREQEREDVVRNRLGVTIERVESVGCEWSRHDPLVVRLVQGFVNERVVQSTVNPVDAEIGKGNEEGELQPGVPATQAPCRALRERVVDQGVAIDFGKEPGYGEDGNDGHCGEGLADLHANLVLEVLGVLECVLVENEDV